MFERWLLMFSRALRNMRQSPLLCGAAIGTVGVSLTIVAFFGILVLNVQKLTGHWSREVQVVAYLDQVPKPEVLHRWQSGIASLQQVQEVRYVSREDALARFRTRLGQDAALLTGVEAEVLPASLEVSLRPDFRNRAGVEVVVSYLRQQAGLKDLRYGQDWLDRFDAFLGLMRAGGFICGGFLLFATLFIVANTIKLTLFARREELEVMALVGATSWFIKAPFLLEAALQGALGGLFSLGCTYLLFAGFLRQGLGSLLLAAGIDSITFLPTSYQLALIALGVLLGVSGSLVSLRRLVRV